MKKIPFELDALKAWFQTSQRDLPWRGIMDPYAIWVSEIMLQQTQVAVVKEYYSRWMLRFPTIAALAEAPLEEAIKMWEGLGYYSRVRNLHRTCQFLMESYGGQLPSSKEDLGQLKGLGPYTIGAIMSFAFHKKAAAVDGNTIRVLARYFNITDDVLKSTTLKKIWAIAEGILPEEQPWLIVEGLIELGATICKRDPICHACPLKGECASYQLGTQGLLPKKGKKVEITSLKRQVFIIAHGDALLIKKGTAGKVMADLYEFPYFEEELADTFPFSFEAKQIKSLPEIEHSYTRFRVKLYPTLWKALDKVVIPEYEWISWDKISKYPFSSGHKRILKLLELEFIANQ